MTKRILFDKFEFPVIKGLDYLKDDKNVNPDYLFINDKNDGFSMYFEKDFPKFSVPKEKQDREYLLFEATTPNRKITLFCPQRHKNLNSVVWYFYVELFDNEGISYELPGQVRVEKEAFCINSSNGKPKFIEVLEQINLKQEKEIKQ